MQEEVVAVELEEVPVEPEKLEELEEHQYSLPPPDPQDHQDLWHLINAHSLNRG